MRIRRPAQRRLKNLPGSELAEVIRVITCCPEQEIVSLLLKHFFHSNNGPEWKWPKSDLLHWSDVLDRFDAIMGSIVRQYNLFHTQSEPFADAQKTLLLYILRFEHLLLENSSGRAHYSSVCHLSLLLSSLDLQVVEATLHIFYLLAIHPTHRHTHQKLLRPFLRSIIPKLESYIYFIHIRRLFNSPISELLVQSNDLPPLTEDSFKFHYYSLKKHDYKHKHSHHSHPGLHEIVLPKEQPSNAKNFQDAIYIIAKEHSVPDQVKPNLSFRLFVLWNIRQLFQQFVSVRSLVIGLYASLSPQNSIPSNILSIDPDIFVDLPTLLNSSDLVSASSLLSLSSCIKVQSATSHIMNGLNVSSLNGPIIALLNRLVSRNFSTFEFSNLLYSYFQLLSAIMVIPNGPSNLLRSGIILITCQLIDISDITDSKRLRLSYKAISFLDNIVYTHSNSAAAFFSADGISLIQQAIHNTIKAKSNVPYINIRLKSLLKFVMRLIQSVGTQEGLRNISETSLPSSIKIVLENPGIFGSDNFAMASLILSTIIHNEPTCLTILQEHDVPQALLKTLNENIPVSSDVLTCLPHVIGALCLNNSGLEMVLKSNVLSKCFSCIDDPRYINALRDEPPSGDNGDVAIILGSSFEELVRHQPQLKQAILNCIIELLDRVPRIQNSDIDTIEPIDDHNKSIEIVSMTEDEYKHHKLKEQQKDESHLVQVIGIVAIFVEMFFQTSQHCKDFLKMSGFEKLIGLYGSRLDYHFGSSRASYHISHLIRHIVESDPESSVSIILETLGNALLELKPLFTKSTLDSSLFAEWVSQSGDGYEEIVHVFQKLIHVHVLIGLLSDVYCSGSIRQYQTNEEDSYSRVVRGRRGLLMQLGNEHGQRLLIELNYLHKHIVKEFHMFKSTVASRLSPLLGKKLDDETHTHVHEIPNPTDKRVRNAQRFVYILSQIPSTIIPLTSAIGRFVMCKKVLSPTINQEQIAEVLVAQMIQNIQKQDLSQDLLANRGLLYYLSIMFAQISVTLFEEVKGTSSSSSLTSHLLINSFVKYNGLDILISWIECLNSLSSSFNKLLFSTLENSHVSWSKISLQLSKERSIATDWILNAPKSISLFQTYSLYLSALSNSIKLLERFLISCKQIDTDILLKLSPIIQTILSNSIYLTLFQFPPQIIQDILSIFYLLSTHSADLLSLQKLFLLWLDSLLTSYDSNDINLILPFVYTGLLRDISSILLVGSYVADHRIVQYLLDPIINSTTISVSHYCRLHILALMMYSKPKIKSLMISQLVSYIPLLISHCSDMLSNTIPYWSDYITPILLILESSLSYPYIDTSIHCPAVYDLVNTCLSRDDSDASLINVLMRILVLLSKSSTLSFDTSLIKTLSSSILALVPLTTHSNFLSTTPNSSILHYPYDSLSVKSSILTLWIIFIRHLLEQNKTLLQYLMVKDIIEREKLIYNPSKGQSVESFIKNHSHLILRDADSFIKIIPNMFHLKESNGSHTIVMNNDIDSRILLTDSQPIDYSCLLDTLFTLLKEPSSLIKCTVLHTLTELFISYPFLSKYLSKNLHFIHYILDNILLYPFGIGADQPVPYATLLSVKSRFQQLYWAGFFICSLFGIQPDNVTDKQATYDHWICFDSTDFVSNLKINMIDIIIQTWKSHESQNRSLPPGMIIEYRYGRWIALADLVNKILHSQISNITCSTINPSIITGTREHSLSTQSIHFIAKHMIEKGLLREMSITLSQIDHHHPYSHPLIRAIFRPIEILTRIGTKLTKNIKNDKEEALFLYEPDVYQDEEYEMESSSDQLVFDPEDDIESSSEDMLSDITRESSSEDMMMEDESESEDIFDEYESDEDDIMEMSDSEEALDELEDEFQNVTENEDIAPMFTRRGNEQDIIVRPSYEHAGLSDDSMELIENNITDSIRNAQLPADEVEDSNLEAGNFEEEWSEEEPGHVVMMRITSDEEGDFRRQQYIFSIDPHIRSNTRIDIERSEDGLNEPRPQIRSADDIVMTRYDSQSMWISSREEFGTTNHSGASTNILQSPLVTLPVSILGLRAMLKAVRHIPGSHLTQHNGILAATQLVPIPDMPQLVISEGKPLDTPYHITNTNPNDMPITHPYYLSLGFPRNESGNPGAQTGFNIGVLYQDSTSDNNNEDDYITPLMFYSPYSMEPFYFSADYYKSADIIKERLRKELKNYVHKFGLIRLKSSLLSVQQFALPYILDDDTIDMILTEIGSLPVNKIKHTKNAEDLIELVVNFYFEQVNQWANIVHSDKLVITNTDRRWYQESVLIHRQDWMYELALDMTEKLTSILSVEDEHEHEQTNQDINDINDNHASPSVSDNPASDGYYHSDIDPHLDTNPDTSINNNDANPSIGTDNDNENNINTSNSILYVTPEMDVSVLEALPEDIRRDVLREYFLERRRNNPNPSITLAITPEFLNSITNPELRELVLRMESQERDRYQSSRMTSITEVTEEHIDEERIGPSEMDIASFMESLDPGLRETVLLEQDDSFLAMLPPALAAEATNLRDRARRFDNPRRLAEFGRLISREISGALGNILESSRTMAVSLDTRPSLRSNGTSASIEASRMFSFSDRSILASIEPISTTSDILDLPSLFSILRTIFHVPILQRRLFLKLLSSICENSSIGKELLFIILVILNEEPSDYQQLDSILNAYLTGRMKKENHLLSFLKHIVPTCSKSISCIALSILDYLLSRVESTVSFFIEPMKPDLGVFSKKMEKRDKRFKQLKDSTMNSSPILVLLSLTSDVLYSTSTETIQGLIRNLFYISSPSWTRDDSRLILPSFVMENLCKLTLLSSVQGKSYHYLIHLLQNIASKGEQERSVILEELVSLTKKQIEQVTSDLKKGFTDSSESLSRLVKAVDELLLPRPTNGTNTTELTDSCGYDKIFQTSGFQQLWNFVDKSLKALKEDNMTLTPLLEAMFIICKYHLISFPKDNIPISIFTERHKDILNAWIRNDPNLIASLYSSFSVIVQYNSNSLDFDNKRTYFKAQLHKKTVERSSNSGMLQVNVRRAHIFEDSYHQLTGRSGVEIKYGRLSVKFYDEEGIDAGGVAREWFSALSRQMFNPDYALFRTSAVDRITYQPNRASYVNPDHLSYFQFIGRIIGKAIYDGRLLDCYFTRSFYKHILNIPVDYKDMEAVDPSFYNSLVWILENDITDVLELTFSTEMDDFGVRKIVDLKPSGRNIQVEEVNKEEYIKLVTEMKLTTAIKPQLNAFLKGFHEIIPANLVSIFNEQELELLISGLPDIDIDDWRNNTEYHGGYNASSSQVVWFWRAVRSFDQELRAKLLQFATGTSKVPLEGFCALQGSSGVQKFQIHKDYGGIERLPTAHTCFNQLDIPEYENYEQLRRNLLLAMNEGNVGFGFA